MKKSWKEALALVAGSLWAMSFLLSGRPPEDWPVTLLCIAGVPVYAFWLFTRWRALRVITIVWCILQALFSAAFIHATLISFMDPVVSVGIKAFGHSVATLNGFGQIALYFGVRGIVFLVLPMIVMRNLTPPTPKTEKRPKAVMDNRLPAPSRNDPHDYKL